MIGLMIGRTDWCKGMQDTITPNFIYVGAPKSGSTWLFEALKEHPQVYVAPEKSTTYFEEDGPDFLRSEVAQVVNSAGRARFRVLTRLAYATGSLLLGLRLRSLLERIIRGPFVEFFPYTPIRIQISAKTKAMLEVVRQRPLPSILQMREFIQKPLPPGGRYT